ncbi:uncharacterized protein GGS22DRAFT_187822 [Annulohypoxylon maeteangense]|uniref:uncharacterized protein n=1 Tax=Annulohypoxylon maeteangense TaxID=1927788 RepID=UPI002007E20C|nr:uncharacterized protein GGS22DRAFT_187822 [Annulohypoxylon maeteangense]KAI0885537.1 hypothetical protein GGS22DRAFT_187822 [Annulohypoxylon maeteangense]
MALSSIGHLLSFTITLYFISRLPNLQQLKTKFIAIQNYCTGTNLATMASSNQTVPKLSEDLLLMIAAQLTDPGDYYRLARTSKTMMNKMDLPRMVLVLEAKALRDYILPHPRGLHRRLQLLTYPHRSVMDWALREGRPMNILWNIIQNYLAYAPDVIYGNEELGLRPAWTYCIRYNNWEALHLFKKYGLTPLDADPAQVMVS